jgi:hypothetical protein
MSNRRYLELYSGHRNRTQFPNPAQYDVLLSQTGQRSPQNACDVVIDSYPIYTFEIGSMNQNGKTFNGGIATLPLLAVDEPSIVTYYNGYLLSTPSGSAISSTTPQITSYSAGTHGVTLGSPLPSTWTSADTYDLLDPSVSYTDKIHIQYKDLYTGKLPYLYNNAYKGYYLYDDVLGYSYLITEYDSDTRILTLSSSLNVTPSIGSIFTIRKNVPSTTGVNSSSSTVYNGVVPTSTNTPTVVKLPSNAVNVDGFYSGFQITVGSNSPTTIVAYDGTTKIASVYPSFDAVIPVTGDSFSIVLTVPTQILIPLPSNFSTLNGSYVGNYFYPTGLPSPAYVNPYVPVSPYVYKIAAYDGNTQVIKLSCPIPTGTFFNIIAAGLMQFNILTPSSDNVYPLVYTGSTVSQNEQVCYEIELISLVLPNTLLDTGSRIAYYPYVYVEFTNLSAPGSQQTNIIYSNNPNAYKALFNCPINDTNNPATTPFLRIDGNGMVQTVKFKPNDNFRFSVFIPDGSLFSTTEKDTLSPLSFTDELQIDAVFSIKRV